jgi:hypothetical protein
MRRRRRRSSLAGPDESSLLGRLVKLVLGLAVLLALAELAVRVMVSDWDETNPARFTVMSKVEGWPDVATGRPGFDGWFVRNGGEIRTRVRINSFGLRDDEPETAADGRLWALGGSVMFGLGVERDQSMAAVAAKQLGMDWYSISSPRADLCGMRALIARMPAESRPKAVVVGLDIETDVKDYDCRADAPATGRSVLTRLREVSALSTVLAVTVKRSDLLYGVAVRLLSGPDKRLLDPGRATELLSATADEVVRLRQMLPADVPVVVVIIPTRQDLIDDTPIHHRPREELVTLLDQRWITVVDPSARFEANDGDDVHFAHDRHWTVLGHRLAGEAVAAKLAEAAK